MCVCASVSARACRCVCGLRVCHKEPAVFCSLETSLERSCPSLLQSLTLNTLAEIVVVVGKTVPTTYTHSSLHFGTHAHVPSRVHAAFSPSLTMLFITLLRSTCRMTFAHQTVYTDVCYVLTQAACEMITTAGGRLSKSERPETRKALDEVLKRLETIGSDTRNVAARIRFVIKDILVGALTHMHTHRRAQHLSCTHCYASPPLQHLVVFLDFDRVDGTCLGAATSALL